MKQMLRLTFLMCLIAGLAACRQSATPNPELVDVVGEIAQVEITLEGPIASAQAEVSGMAWCGDQLILLPQYPAMYGEDGMGSVFSISRVQLEAYLTSENPDPIEPALIPFDSADFTDEISGFEGFEAIAFNGSEFYVTSETRAGDGMLGYLVSGSVEGECASLELEPNTRTAIQPQADLSNMSDETIIVYQDQVHTIYEANGVNVNPDPVVHVFDLSLDPVGELSLSNIEYRITDATTVDDDGIFWAINYFYPGDTKLKPADDQIALEYGIGMTHQSAEQVERLVAFQFQEGAITLAGIAPIYLALEEESSNWEGIVRFLDGFLLVTDEYPTTRLVYITDLNSRKLSSSLPD